MRAVKRDTAHIEALCLIGPPVNRSRSRLPLKARPLPYRVGIVSWNFRHAPPARRPNLTGLTSDTAGVAGLSGPAPKVPPVTDGCEHTTRFLEPPAASGHPWRLPDLNAKKAQQQPLPSSTRPSSRREHP